MAKLTKRQKALQGKVETTKLYVIDDALALLKECATAKFDESIDVSVQLGVDAKKSDQVVRGAVVMPNGIGKTKRVAVFTQGAKAEEAKAAGADVVGMDDLAAEVKAGNINFDESIDVSVQLGVDAKKSDQVVRGAVVMPNGIGKTKRVAVFTQGAKAEEAKAAGADVVGMDDLAAEVKAGNINFDVVIASPDAMRVVGQLGQILGPRGLMPNPKVGTVTPDVATAVKNAKAGQVQFRVDKAGIIHGTIGRRSFDNEKLRGNLQALLEALNKAKPASSKGVYLRKVAVSSTMGVGVRVDVGSINAAAAA